jgi:hypothetical protein
VGFFAQIVAASVVSRISGVGELLDKIDDGSPKLRIRARMDALGELGTIRGLIWCGERRCLRRFFEGLAGRDELGTIHGRGGTRAATQAHHILEAGRPRRRVTAPRSAAGLRCPHRDPFARNSGQGRLLARILAFAGTAGGGDRVKRFCDGVTISQPTKLQIRVLFSC